MDLYIDIYRLLWKAYVDAPDAVLRDILEATDSKLGFNVLMHSCKCGDPDNLKHFLELYKKHYDVSVIQNMVRKKEGHLR